MHIYHILNSTLYEEKQENIIEETLFNDTSIIPLLKNSKIILVEIKPGKTLNINMNLTPDELECLVTLLKQHKGYFAWE